MASCHIACFQRRRRLPVFLVYSRPLDCFSCEAALAINRASSHLEWVGQDDDSQQMDEMLPVRRCRCGFDVTPRSRPASGAGFWPSCSRVSHPRAARGLVEDCRRLIEAIELKSVDAPWKQRMKVRATALLNAAEQFERGAKRPATNPEEWRGAMENVRHAYQPIAGELALPALTAPAVRRIAERIGLKIASLEKAMRPGPMVPPPGGPYDRAALQAALKSTHAAAGNLVFLLGRGLGTAAPENRIMEDLRTWNQQLVAYQQFVELSRPPWPKPRRDFTRCGTQPESWAGSLKKSGCPRRSPRRGTRSRPRSKSRE